MPLIREASDLHLEFKHPFFLPALPEDSDTILVLAGDICVVDTFSRAKDFFIDVCKRFKHVIYVFGNHEYYSGSIIRAQSKFNELFNYACSELELEFTNFHVLQKETIEFDGLVFHGTTLWSDFEDASPLSLLDCNSILRDFKYIMTGTAFNPFLKKFTAEYAYSIHKIQLAWLEKSLEAHKDKMNVVVTHHAPSYLSISDEFRGNRINGAYVTDLSELIIKYQPKLFFHGHMHDSFEYNILDTKVICNPRGYVERINDDGTQKVENSNFDPYLRLEI